MRIASTFLLAAALLACTAGSAAADATIARSGGVADPYAPGNEDIVYTGSQTGDNLDVTDSPGSIRFRDVYQTLTAGPGCVNEDEHEVKCVDDNLDEVRVNLRGGDDSFGPGNSGFEHAVRVDGGEGDDDIYGGYTPGDVLLGGPGDDYLAGGEGSGGGPGADTLRGQGDDDTLIGGGGADDLAGGTGDDRYFGGAGADLMVDTGSGRDVVSYTFATGPLTVDIGGAGGNDGEPGEGDTVGADIEEVYGGGFDDKLTGDGDGNLLVGGPGKDTLDGLGGDDRLYGSGDNDILKGGANQDVLEGEENEDSLDGGLGADILRGGKGNDLLGGGLGTFDDSLDGGEGDDGMTGGPGTDTVTYSSRTEPVTARTGGGVTSGIAGEKDAIVADVENLIGGTQGDTLTGNDGANQLNGGPGPDTLDGLGGQDTLVGASGDDALRSRDGGAVDKDLCGLGVDTVTADAQDAPSADCETVDVPAAPGTGGADQPGTPSAPAGPGGPSGRGPAATGPLVAIAKRGARTTKLVRLKLSCPKKPGRRCIGTLVLRGRKAIGSRKFSIAAGRSLTVKVRLGRTARKLLGRKRKVKIRATATTRSAGATARTAVRSVALTRRSR